jgi:hypothetical protein
VNTKRKFLKEIKSATPMNTQGIRKQNSFISVIWINQISNIPLSQRLTQSKALTLFSSMKAEKVRKPQQRKSEASKG